MRPMFTMPFSWRGTFGFGAMKDFRDKWNNMTIEEKIELIDKHMQECKQPDNECCGGEYFQHGPWGAHGEQLRERWAKMSTEEKARFIQSREEAFKEFHCHEGRPDVDTIVKSIDARCEEWSKKTAGEKKAFVEGWREAMHSHHHGHGHHGSGHGHGGGREAFGLRDREGFGCGFSGFGGFEGCPEGSEGFGR